MSEINMKQETAKTTKTYKAWAVLRVNDDELVTELDGIPHLFPTKQAAVSWGFGSPGHPHVPVQVVISRNE